MGDFETKTHQRIRIPGAIDSGSEYWSPKAVAGCELWVAADKMQGFSDDDPVGLWLDLSGEENNITQAAATEKPLYKVDMINELPAVYFDNTNDGMFGSVNLSNPYSVFVVYNSITTGGNRRCLQGASNNWIIGPYGGGHKFYNGAWIDGPAIVADEFIYARAQGTGSGAEFWVNGSSMGTNGLTLTPAVLNLGYEGAYPEVLNGHIAEIAAYNAEVSDADATLIEAYFKAKYSL